METRRIGSLEVSVLGLGCGSLGAMVDETGARAIVAAAREQGVTFFDLSDRQVAAEEWVGRAVRSSRDEVVLATKFGSRVAPGVEACAAPAHVRAAVDRSLRRLGTDRIDLYQLHRPDPATPIADTLGALAQLVAAGKVREIGCSKFSADQLLEAEAAASSGVRFVSVQNRLNLLEPGDAQSVLPVCERLGIAYVPYCPLAGGLLTGKYERGRPPPAGTRFAEWDRWRARVPEWLTAENFDRLDRLAAWAREHGRSLVELAFAFLLAHRPVATVIAGASSPAHVERNAAACGSWHLEPDELAELELLAG
ncbi:MAG TPA: aldo/keto reductase [Acidimicrobiales bacterium]|nr:aldo/keto reductase [Acidimicrobiales bacterium]